MFAKYIIIGTIVYLIEWSILSLITEISDLTILNGRVISFPIALVIAWYLNRNMTFKSKNHNKISEFKMYTMVNISGLILNIITYQICIMYINISFICLGLAGLAGLMTNYLGSKHIVFRFQSK